MDEALELGVYLPQSFANANEQAYLDFLWSAFQTNYEAGRYEFASLAFHLLYMSFVSFSIWQIKLARPDQFAMAMVGFDRHESALMNCKVPFDFFDSLREGQIFRFLKLIGCTNQQVGEFAKFVQKRNKIAHPTGTVFFNDQAAIDTEISKMMKEVRNIEEHMRSVIRELYEAFLKGESSDPDLRQYPDYADEVRVNLVHASYMSEADIAYCRQYDLADLEGEPNLFEMQALHMALLETYPDEEAVAA